MEAISKRKLKERTKRKTNPSVVDTIKEANKHENWTYLAKILSSSRRKYSSVNLEEIDKQTKEGDSVIIPGKILSKGKISKKIRICAMSFSGKATDKIKESKAEAISLLQEIEKNPKAEGVKIIR